MHAYMRAVLLVVFLFVVAASSKKAELITESDVGGNEELRDFLTNKEHAFDTYEHVEMTVHKGHKPTLFIADEGGKIIVAHDVTHMQPSDLQSLLANHGFKMGGAAKRAKLVLARRAAHIAKQQQQQQQQAKDDKLDSISN